MSAQTDNPTGGVVGSEVEEVTAELENLAVLCSAIPEISADLGDISAQVDGLDRSVDELMNDDFAELESELATLSDALEQLTGNVLDLEQTVNEEVDALRSRQDDLEARLDAVEACFSTDLLAQQESHVEAQGREMPFDRGDTRELFVEEVMGGPKPTLRGTIEKVQTFVDVDDHSEYEEGEIIEIVITDLRENAAHAVPAAEFGE